MGYTRLLNVDLDLYSATILDTLVSALQPEMLVLNHESHKASLELANLQPTTIDEAIQEFHKVFQALPSSERLAWMQCDKRCLNIGIQTETSPQQVTFQLSGDTLENLRAMQAILEFTVYAPVVKIGSQSVSRRT